MPYIALEVVQEAKRMDLLTYLKNYELYELVHFSGNTYTTKTHDSLKISNGKWMWWSRGIGGRSAVDYLIKVRGYTFMEAVQTIAGQAAVTPPVSLPAEKTTEKKLLLPKPNRYQTQAVSYLNRRGIDTDIIRFCLQSGIVYESENYHNAVFVGMDKGGYCIWTVRTVPFMLIEKRSEMKMDREEIYEMVIREMTETAVRERNEQSPEEQELQDKVARLSKEMQEKIKDLPEDVKKAITDYVEATLLAADHDCLYLYARGAKDCVTLLKKLGVL